MCVSGRGGEGGGMMSTSTEILLRSFLCRIHELLRDGEVTTLISIVLVVADDLFGLFGSKLCFKAALRPQKR